MGKFFCGGASSPIPPAMPLAWLVGGGQRALLKTICLSLQTRDYAERRFKPFPKTATQGDDFYPKAAKIPDSRDQILEWRRSSLKTATRGDDFYPKAMLVAPEAIRSIAGGSGE